MGKICNYRLLNAFRTRNLDAPRTIVFLAWLISLYAFLAILLLNLSGVSRQHVRNSATGEWLPRMKNPALQLMSWNLEGPPPVGINNYYHYTLFLNRLCIVDRARTRAEHGTCMPGMPSLMPFTVDSLAPNEALSKSRPFGIVGVIDLVAPFACYAVAAICLVLTMVTLLPDLIGNGFFSTSSEVLRADCDDDDADGYELGDAKQLLSPRLHGRAISTAIPMMPTPRQAFGSFWLSASAIMLAISAAFMLAGSICVTVLMDRMKNRMQSVPDVSEIKVPYSTTIATIWTATGLVIAASIILGACSLLGNFGLFWMRLPWFQIRPRLRGL